MRIAGYSFESYWQGLYACKILEFHNPPFLKYNYVLLTVSDHSNSVKSDKIGGDVKKIYSKISHLCQNWPEKWTRHSKTMKNELLDILIELILRLLPKICDLRQFCVNIMPKIMLGISHEQIGDFWAINLTHYN